MIRSSLLPELVLLWNEGHSCSEIAATLNARHAASYSDRSIARAVQQINRDGLYKLVPHLRGGRHRATLHERRVQTLKPLDSIFSRRKR